MLINLDGKALFLSGRRVCALPGGHAPGPTLASMSMGVMPGDLDPSEWGLCGCGHGHCAVYLYTNRILMLNKYTSRVVLVSSISLPDAVKHSKARPEHSRSVYQKVPQKLLVVTMGQGGGYWYWEDIR